MQLEPGMRVRCVDSSLLSYMLKDGDEFTVAGVPEWDRSCVELREFPTQIFRARRFKPVVRVKAGAVYTGKAFDNLVTRAVEMFGRLPPEIQAAHREEQRQSWVRGKLALRKMGLG